MRVHLPEDVDDTGGVCLSWNTAGTSTRQSLVLVESHYPVLVQTQTCVFGSLCSSVFLATTYKIPTFIHREIKILGSRPLSLNEYIGSLSDISEGKKLTNQ